MRERERDREDRKFAQVSPLASKGPAVSPTSAVTDHPLSACASALHVSVLSCEKMWILSACWGYCMDKDNVHGTSDMRWSFNKWYI